MANEITVWNKVMSSALAIPGVKVDRELFLRSQLRPYCSAGELEQALVNPVAVLSKKRLESLANSCINNHLWKVSSLSFAAGLPGGLTMAATIPADMAQYYYHTFVLAQKLAYLYGIPDLCDERGNFTEKSQDMLTVFVGVMMGVAAATKAIRDICSEFAKQVAKRLPQQALTKTGYYPIIKEIAKWIGVSLTKESFAKGVSKVVPFIGGVVSGALTAATFKPAADRLHAKLKEQMYDISTSARQINYASSSWNNGSSMRGVEIIENSYPSSITSNGGEIRKLYRNGKKFAASAYFREAYNCTWDEAGRMLEKYVHG